MRIKSKELQSIMDEYRLSDIYLEENKVHDPYEKYRRPVGPIKLSFIGEPKKGYNDGMSRERANPFRQRNIDRNYRRMEEARRKKAERAILKEIAREKELEKKKEEEKDRKQFGSFGRIRDGKFILTTSKHALPHLSNEIHHNKRSAEKRMLVAKARAENKKRRAIESKEDFAKLRDELERAKDFRELNNLDSIDRGALK